MHQRNSDNNFRVHKEALRKEFSYACVYCGTREPELGGAQSFGIDHYKPKSIFKSLVNSYSNLLYACRNCNSYKGAYWPNTAQRILRQVILNPRKNKIHAHIDQSKFAWIGKTIRGAWNILKLRLDSPVLVKRREDRLRTERTIHRLENILSESAIALEGARSNSDTQEVIKIEMDMSDLLEEINNLRRKISGPLD